MYEAERSGGGGGGGETGGEEEDRETEGVGREISLKQELYDVIFRSRLNGNFNYDHLSVTLNLELFFFSKYSFPFHSLIWK